MAAARQREERSAGRMNNRSGRRRRAAADATRSRSVRPGFSHEKALIFGVIQTLAGIAALVLGVVSISTRAWGYYYAAGFWSGTFFFIAGVFGLASARRKSNCAIVTFMVFSAMSAILALVTLTLSSIGVATENLLFQQLHAEQNPAAHNGQGNALAVHSLIIVVSVIAAVCGTASSIVGCRAVCSIWYLPDNPYHSAGDLQTPTSTEFSTGYRHNSNLQYLIDPDLRSQAQHLFSTSGGGHDPGAALGPSICPPASYEYPSSNLVTPPTSSLVPPPSGPQQIAILAPAADGSVYGMVQATSDQSGGISQVMYIMPNTGPCPQPGVAPDVTVVGERPITPPPSYSQINLTQVGLDETDNSNSRTAACSTTSPPAIGGQTMPELPAYTPTTLPTTCGSHSNHHSPIETTFPTQLPPLDRLIPLTGTRVQRSHRSSSGQQRSSSSNVPSRTSGTQTCSSISGVAPTASSSTSAATTSSSHSHQHSHAAQLQTQHVHQQRSGHRSAQLNTSLSPTTSSSFQPHNNRHSMVMGSSTMIDHHHHQRELEVHGARRPLSGDYQPHHPPSALTEVNNPGAGGGACHRHSHSVGTQVNGTSRSSNSRSNAPLRHSTSSSGSSSRNAPGISNTEATVHTSSSAGCSSSNRASRGGRERHSKGHSASGEQLMSNSSELHSAEPTEHNASSSNSGVTMRSSSHSHRSSQSAHWRLSGSFMPPPQPMLGTSMTSHPQELVVTSFPSEMTSSASSEPVRASSGLQQLRRWMPPAVQPFRQSSDPQQQATASTLSPLNSVL